jgi:hypothetical protein
MPLGEKWLKSWWCLNVEVMLYQEAGLFICSDQTNRIQSDNLALPSTSMKKYFTSTQGSSALPVWTGESFLSQLDFSNLSSHISNGGNPSPHFPQKSCNIKKTRLSRITSGESLQLVCSFFKNGGAASSPFHTPLPFALIRLLVLIYLLFFKKIKNWKDCHSQVTSK